MSISPDAYYTDITTWNANTEPLRLDPNTLPTTPPHTHLHRSQADMSGTWDDTPAAADDSWQSASFEHDAAIAGELQAQELGRAFGGMALEGEPRRQGPPPVRKPREYGPLSFLLTLSLTSEHLPYFPFVPLVGFFDGWVIKGNCAQAISTHLMIEPDPEPTMTSDEAWAAILSANQEKDLDDFKVFFLEYVRNNKHLTFVDLEKKFRESHFDVYLIAMVTSHTAP